MTGKMSAARWLGLADMGAAAESAAILATDVEELLNHVRFDDQTGRAGTRCGSLLHYGVRCYAGRLVDESFMAELASDIADALRRCEPRIDPGSIDLRPVDAPRHVRSRCRLRLRARLVEDEAPIDWGIRYDAHFGAIAISQGAEG